MSQTIKKITKTECPTGLRMDFLPNAVGGNIVQCVKYEHLTFAFMDKASPDYGSGFWNFYSLSNGGFYMAPEIDGDIRMEWEDNYFEGKMSADAAGISISLLAQNYFAWHVNRERFADKYHQLLDYAAQHKEAPAIYRFID
ncbi:MAG: antirestriction protein [Verrucomicrobiota bacterium]